MSRADHFANLAADVRRDERVELVHARVVRLLAAPQGARAPLTEFSLAAARLGEKRARGVIEAELGTVMEMPQEAQVAALDAIFAAHGQLEGDERETADRELDQAIGDALGGPQRIFVRDHLLEVGWVRP